MTSRHQDVETILYGFKRITLKNVTALDDKPAHISRLRDKKWLQDCMKPQLETCVPEEIAFLYEVARGSMVYGMYFQPIASLATEQLYRVLEAGARHRCNQLGLFKNKSGKKKVLPDTEFKKIVSALKQAGKIPDCDFDDWETMPFLRNLYSHPKYQIIQPELTQPKISPVTMAAHTADLLNRLFKQA